MKRYLQASLQTIDEQASLVVRSSPQDPLQGAVLANASAIEALAEMAEAGFCRLPERRPRLSLIDCGFNRWLLQGWTAENGRARTDTCRQNCACR